MTYPSIDRVLTGQQIRYWMELRGVSVRDIREQLSFESVQSIYQWLNGRNLPSVDNLYALSDLLQVPIDVLLCGSRSLETVCFVSRSAQEVQVCYQTDAA